MAKPKHARCNNYTRPCSSSSSTQPRKHTQRVPSPAVLSALALIATTSPVVAGGPLPLPTPPAFLCPFIERDSINPSSGTLLTPSPRASVPSSSTPSPSPSPSPTPTTSHHSKLFAGVADRYVQGSDNLWRKTDSWTLFGSTCCSSSSASSTQSQSSSSQTSMPTSTPTPVQFDTSVLPAGWDSTSSPSSSTESTIILALAIVLAGSICVFMIGCVFWRKRKKRARDIERKLGQLGADDESQDNDREKDARGKMRVWAKASARWKSNIRQSARRRRKRPMASSTADRPLSPTCHDSPPLSGIVPSAPSRRGSFVSEEPDPSRSQEVSCVNDNVTEQPAVLHDPPRSASPPTYGASFVLPDSLHAVRRGSQLSFIEDEPLPYTPPSDGHVATDDKAQLAHMRELASSPPIMTDAAGAGTMQSVSAPAFHEVEDDLEDSGIDLSTAPISCHDFGFPPSFPPPPSKSNLPLGYLDDHTLCYGGGDDIPIPLPVPEPSGIPGALPSAPPIDDPGLVPSAPSLEGDDDLFQDWDGAASHVPEAPTSADLDSTPACAIESPISPSHSVLSIRESATRDGILPRYHP